MLRERVIQPELLDTLSPEEAAASLRDLVRINARWGGLSTLRWILRQVAPAGPFTFLDVGSASGDMGQEVRRLYPQAQVTSLDYLESHLLAAPHPKVAGDAFSLPFKDASYDYVFCSLFLHHFTNEQVVALLREFSRVARKNVLIIDLERHVISYWFLPASAWLFGWDRVTLNDGPISVAAAFRKEELIALAHKAGLDAQAKVFRPAFRISLIAK